MKKLAAAALALCGLGLVVWSVLAHPWGWLYGLGVHPYPASSSTPWTYQMWSGILPALTVMTLFGSLGGMYHLHNCHQDGCWRIGKHRIAGTPWCDRHKDLAKPAVSTEDLLLRIEALLEHAAADSKAANNAAASLGQQVLAELRESR